MHEDWIRPAFATANVGALMSTRAGGVSRGPFESLNLGSAVGDDPQAVVENRRRFAAALGGAAVWLQQVHGTRVVPLTPADASAPTHEADACVTSETGVACVIQVADCLPVLFAAPEGRAVAAAHAGWRGLAAGVLEATVAALCERSGAAPRDIEAWLGPCIGPNEFEVGADVLAGFGAEAARPHPRFAARAGQPGKWLADLPGLARDRLAALGLTRVSGGSWCTVGDPSRFFSFRRDRPVFGNSGRLAAAIWRRG
ncbi:peptidoglycan editing factor PgeF [Caldimonas sp. KR1-144]|uniref:peptidoglycan editing factor PgeF n=1 Tax=Caldimonas sp. KR1-144 TaxID=3400911 RepID=UPI003C0E22BC